MKLLAPRSLTLLLGLSMCGLTGYIIYNYFKKDEDEDDFYSTIPIKSNFKIIEIPIPQHLVRVLIGRNGTTIRNLEKKTNTRIKFRDQNDKTDKLCIVKGERDSCKLAETLIQDLLDSESVIEYQDLWVRDCDAGRIIGRMGENKMQIQSISGAKINVEKRMEGNELRRVNIRGTQQQIALAKSLIQQTIEKNEINRTQIESTLAKREPRGPVKSPSPKFDPVKSERISPVQGQADSQFEVYVSAMIDPSHFWLQIVGVKATELDQLVEEMTEFYSREENRENHMISNVNREDLVAATFSFDNKWYRAEVLSVLKDNPEVQVELFYADYGDTDIVPVSQVYELRTDFLRLPFQAIECFLARIEPSGANWSDEAILRFEELTHLAQWKKLSARINGYCTKEKIRAKREGSPVPGIDLFDVIDDQDIDIAQELVNGGFATYKKDVELRSTSSRATSNSSVDLIA